MLQKVCHETRLRAGWFRTGRISFIIFKVFVNNTYRLHNSSTFFKVKIILFWFFFSIPLEMHSDVHGSLHGLVEPSLPDIRSTVTTRAIEHVMGNSSGSETQSPIQRTIYGQNVVCVISCDSKICFPYQTICVSIYFNIMYLNRFGQCTQFLFVSISQIVSFELCKRILCIICDNVVKDTHFACASYVVIENYRYKYIEHYI